LGPDYGPLLGPDCADWRLGASLVAASACLAGRPRFGHWVENGGGPAAKWRNARSPFFRPMRVGQLFAANATRLAQKKRMSPKKPQTKLNIKNYTLMHERLDGVHQDGVLGVPRNREGLLQNVIPILME